MTAGLAARQAAHDILLRVEQTDAFADVLLAERLAGASLDERDAALVTRLVYGTLAWQGRLDHHLAGALRRPLDQLEPPVRAALRLGAFQLLFLDRVPAFAVVDTSVEVTRRAGQPRASGLVNAVLRRVAPAGAPSTALPELPDDPIGRLAIEWSHPRWLVEHWERKFGRDELPRLLAANNESGRTTIRTNPRRADRDQLAESLRRDGFSVEKGRWAPQALTLEQHAARLRQHPAHAAGLLSFQGEASQLAAELLAPDAPRSILDACAAPGGKSLALAERIPAAHVVALDPQAGGLRTLERDAARLGVSVQPIVADARRPPLRARFEAVLVDAPCTGLGTLRRHPEIRWRRVETDPERLGALQREILDAAAALVAPGGLLVFAVCTLTAPENEGVVRGFLREHPEFDVEPASVSLPPPARALVTPAGFLETLPHRDGLDGFFAARLRRRRLDSHPALR